MTEIGFIRHGITE